jgi:hypothetical protein
MEVSVSFYLIWSGEEEIVLATSSVIYTEAICGSATRSVTIMRSNGTETSNQNQSILRRHSNSLSTRRCIALGAVILVDKELGIVFFLGPHDYHSFQQGNRYLISSVWRVILGD